MDSLCTLLSRWLYWRPIYNLLVTDILGVDIVAMNRTRVNTAVYQEGGLKLYQWKLLLNSFC